MSLIPNEDLDFAGSVIGALRKLSEERGLTSEKGLMVAYAATAHDLVVCVGFERFYVEMSRVFIELLSDHIRLEAEETVSAES